MPQIAAVTIPIRINRARSLIAYSKEERPRPGQHFDRGRLFNESGWILPIVPHDA